MSAACLLFYVAPAAIVQIPQVQDEMAIKVRRILSGRLNVPVEIGNVGLDWIHRLVVRDVVLRDEQADTLFVADHLSVGIDWWPLLRGKYVLADVRLAGFHLNMRRASPGGALNFQFLIDAFASRDTTKSSGLDLQIKSVQLRRGQLNYSVSGTPESMSFDPQHVAVHDLNGQIKLHALTADSMDMQIVRLRFEERSGFKINRLSLAFTANADSAAIHDLTALMPATSLRIDTASVCYHELDSLHLWVSKAPVRLKMAPSSICLKDIAAFVPAFAGFTSIVDVTAEASGVADDFSLDGLRLEMNHSASILGKIRLKGLACGDAPYLVGKIDSASVTAEGLARVISHFKAQPVTLPAPVRRLNNLRFTGEVSGFLDNLVAYGNLQSDIGSIDMDLFVGSRKDENKALYLKGQIASTELKLNRLFDEGNAYGIVRFRGEVDASRPYGESFSGNIDVQIHEMDYNDYRYENILLSGSFGASEYDGSISIDDPNGKLRAEGLFKYDGENSLFDFAADIRDVRPAALHLTDKYDDPAFSLKVSANFTGNNIDLFRGRIVADDFSFTTRTDSFRLDSLRIDANGSGRELIVSSDLLNGEINGMYSFRTLVPSLLHTGSIYLPALSHVAPHARDLSGNAFRFSMEIENTEKLSQTFKLPFSIVEKSAISGEYDNTANRVRLDLSLPKYKIGKSRFEDGSIRFTNRDDRLKLQIKTTQINKRQNHNLFEVSSEAIDNKIETVFSLANAEDRTVNVGISTTTRISPGTDANGRKSLQAEMLFLPDQLLLKDSLWNLEPSSVTIAGGHTTIHNFNIFNGEQYLRINGSVSEQYPRNDIRIDLNKIELSHIFDIVDIPALQFGGQATGFISMNNLHETPNINTELEVQNFSFNRTVQGRLNLFGQWDNSENGILMLGSLYRDSANWTDISGYIYPSGKSENVSIFFDAKEIDMRMLSPYVDAFTNTIEGRGSGEIHLFGTFSNLTLEGKAFVKDGLIGVDVLNTRYTFNDSIEIRPDAIAGRNITVYDRDGNSGEISFEMNHTFLRDFSFHSEMQLQHILLYDMPERINPRIYGTVYGSGNGRIAWANQLVTIDANIQNSPNSFMGFNFMNGSSAEDYDFIFFKAPDMSRVPDGGTAVLPDASPRPDGDGEGTSLRINCFLDVTPSAALELVMDPVGGDKIRGNGSGDIQVQYESNSDLAMFGGFTVQSGSYNFSLQQVLHKDFKIRDGSRIDFSGNPLDAMLGINAMYYLTASIEDLDQSLVKETLRTSVPVNCILNLNGRMQSPTISFDLEFPNSNNELQRQVKSFISTEDMMARQIVYLLVLNKFYTPDYSRNDYRANEFSAVASSALSAQLSNILNSLTDKVQIGTNIRSRQDGVSDTEVEMLLSSQLLDNRLLFNGNFGYKNNFIQSSAFIGEFDLEYRLTPGGEIRLKAYNHANDMYRYNMKSLTRQGVGLMYYKDFDSLGHIFRQRKITRPETDRGEHLISTSAESVDR
ncbi:MAG: translocation/assembly module TamB domain-containing protein [Tannerella sp.]|nr:translocation/assembly module TamB domain-containing protein [Tannerella sp.]